MSSNKKQTGKVNYFMVLAGGYLVYLAWKLFRGAAAGETDQPLVGVVGGIVFVAVGAMVLLREWKAYRYGQEHIDDPESWSDEPEELLEDQQDEDAETEEEPAELPEEGGEET